MSEKSFKVIVTGGAGFIGSHLTEALLERGFEVWVIDNLSTGKKENVNPRAIFHEADIRDFSKLGPLFQGAEYVFHAAALPRVEPSIQNPRASHEVNVDGTLNVLVASRDAGAKRVIYSSSSSAYGNQTKLPLQENAECHPVSPYALQKYIGELYGRLFSEIYGLSTVSLRYFNVYGLRAPTEGAYALVLGKFINQKLRKEPLTIVPDGNQSRDFTHVKDVVRANLLAAESSGAGRGEIINIGAGRSRSVLEIADLIGGPRKFIEPRLEPKHTLADNSKARELLGWEPTISLEEGIAELKKFYKIA